MAVSKAIIFGRFPSFLENERYWYTGICHRPLQSYESGKGESGKLPLLKLYPNVTFLKLKFSMCL